MQPVIDTWIWIRGQSYRLRITYDLWGGVQPYWIARISSRADGLFDYYDVRILSERSAYHAYTAALRAFRWYALTPYRQYDLKLRHGHPFNR